MATLFDMGSLRGKITSAYVVLVTGAVVLGIIAFLDLLFLERQIAEGEVVSDLQDAISEMRREEKNLFLYLDRGAFTRADEYAVTALNIVRSHKSSLDEIMRLSDPSSMLEDLNSYRLKLGIWDSALIDKQKPIEDEIRALGHQIYLTVESLSKQERSLLAETIQKSKWFLLISFSIIGLGIYLVGRQLKSAVVTPLKQLESRLLSIARGKFDHLEPPSNDREFMTFTDAFNRMLKELEVRQKRMLHSEKLASLGTLAAGVAHELNNPLSNISSSCQLLIEELSEADPDQLDTWLRQIDSETERGQNIVRSLLDFGSQRNFQKNKIKLLDLVNEIKVITGKMLQEYSAKLTVTVPDNLVLEVDKQRMQQLFINLIQNALQAAGEGAHVRISAMLCERGVAMIPNNAEVVGNLKCITDYEGWFVEILVSDDGPGIPRDNLSKVLDPFFTTSEPSQGVGLGLFIVQEIVQEHDGCLAIASRPSRGTQVIVLLPGEESSHG